MTTPKLCLPFVAAILVLIIGAYIVWRLIQFCQDHFPARNDPPTEPNATNVVDEAAFILQPSASQPAPADNQLASASSAGPADGCFFQVAVMLLPDGGIYLTNCAIPQLETKAQLDAEMASLGLSYYKTTAPDDIHWDGTQLTVGSADSAVRVVIERSMDMITWKPVATNNIPADRIIAATLLAPCGTNCFWRAAR